MKSAELYTLDGVVFTNHDPFTIETVAKYFRQDPLVYTAPPIQSLDRTPEDTWRMSPKQLTQYVSQSFSTVIPDSMYYLWGRDGVDVYGNTGRPNKLPWINLTTRTIAEGHLSARFVDVFYRPRDVSGIMSKGEAILRLLDKYEKVTHYDNNPWVIFGLARAIPRAHFVLVQGLNSGVLFSQEQADLFGNVKVEGRLVYTEPDTVTSVVKIHKNKRYPSVFVKRERDLKKKNPPRVPTL